MFCTSLVLFLVKSKNYTKTVRQTREEGTVSKRGSVLCTSLTHDTMTFSQQHGIKLIN